MGKKQRVTIVDEGVTHFSFGPVIGVSWVGLKTAETCEGVDDDVSGVYIAMSDAIFMQKF